MVTSGSKGLFCSINICGLSHRSHFMLNKYIFDKDIAVLGLQETGLLESSQYRDLINMTTYVDTNKQINKGCAIFVKKGIMFTQIVEVSHLSKNIDSVWGMLYINGKRFMVGCVYLKLGYKNGVKEMLSML